MKYRTNKKESKLISCRLDLDMYNFLKSNNININATINNILKIILLDKKYNEKMQKNDVKIIYWR